MSRPTRTDLSRTLLLLLSFAVGSVLPGCGSKGMPATDIAEQSANFEDAAAKFTAKDYVGAKAAIQSAIGGGGLTVDQASEALLILVESAIETGDLDLAASELKNAEAAAMDMARVYLLQGKLARKRGNEAAAQEAFQKAQATDPNVVIPGV